MKTSIKALVRPKLPRDPLFRLLAVNGLAGTAIAGLVLGGIFLGNIGNLRVLVMSAEDPVLPVIMLAFGLFITLGSVVMGSAIMLLGQGGQNGNGKGGGARRRPPVLFTGQLKPVPVPAKAGYRHDLRR
ncbi:hypothetical protein FMN63_12080 [Stappia sp. BW2]|jgi:hypothetical protein|uniref:hypothetical protein n=1 Tax=Stappia sp. BW2 TaxID=2592622 RepID=UPI0011DE683A|nr:hypothetical protein [Stappia sp. BW2]TYC66856.1 hypothetical protein FMN63_12080 [Stappia sp. BW2]